MKRLKRIIAMGAASVLAIFIALVVGVTPASAASSYDGVIQVTPTLSVYTDWPTNTHTMDISSTWWHDLQQAANLRDGQGISGWQLGFSTAVDKIVNSGGSYGVYVTSTSSGNIINFVGTLDPNAYCEFTGAPSVGGTFQCDSAPGYNIVREDYFTYGTFGGNGCTTPGGWSFCSDNGMAIYDNPLVVAGGPFNPFYADYASLAYIQFYFMNFDIHYPTGYAGAVIPQNHLNTMRNYVAMGDSYSSGEGAEPFYTQTDQGAINECHRSEKSYAMLLDEDDTTNLSLQSNVACSGATMTDVLSSGNTSNGSWNSPAQVASLNPQTNIITLTIGGNDVGFSGYMTQCVLGSCGPISNPSLYNAVSSAINSTAFSNDLVSTYSAILSDAPNADLYVADYPYLTTNLTVLCDGVDLSGVYSLQSQLNTVIHNAIASVGSSRIHLVDTNASGSPFSGHTVCSPAPYFNNDILLPTYRQRYSYHPNMYGQAALGSLFRSAIG